MQRHTAAAEAWLQILDESIIGREVGGGIARRGRSLISTIALLIQGSNETIVGTDRRITWQWRSCNRVARSTVVAGKAIFKL